MESQARLAHHLSSRNRFGQRINLVEFDQEKVRGLLRGFPRKDCLQMWQAQPKRLTMILLYLSLGICLYEAFKLKLTISSDHGTV